MQKAGLMCSQEVGGGGSRRTRRSPPALSAADPQAPPAACAAAAACAAPAPADSAQAVHQTCPTCSLPAQHSHTKKTPLQTLRACLCLCAPLLHDPRRRSRTTHVCAHQRCCRPRLRVFLHQSSLRILQATVALSSLQKYRPLRDLFVSLSLFLSPMLGVSLSVPSAAHGTGCRGCAAVRVTCDTPHSADARHSLHGTHWNIHRSQMNEYHCRVHHRVRWDPLNRARADAAVEVRHRRSHRHPAKDSHAGAALTPTHAGQSTKSSCTHPSLHTRCHTESTAMVTWCDYY